MKLFKMSNGTNVVFFEAYDAKEATHKAINLADHSKAVRIDEIKDRVQFTRIKNDVNGNPRYVAHFHAFINDKEYETLSIDQRYAHALNKARKIGGKKFHNKQYGGGIVFQSYNTTDLEISILKLKGE